MRMKERIKRIEKSCPCDLIAFFSVPNRYSESERVKIERQLWNEYLEHGGSSRAHPVFIAGLTGENLPMFLCVQSKREVLTEIEAAGRRRMASLKG
jgi:hypothetical protein